MKSGVSLIVPLALAVLSTIAPDGPARAADRARITGLSDVAFGTINGTGDQTASQSLCAYSSSSTNGYSVMASGSGSGGAFALSSGAAQLPYEVLWADSANQTGGTALVANAVQSGHVSVASQQTCNSGPSSSASLTIVIRDATHSAAGAGTYSGSLSLTIAPE